MFVPQPTTKYCCWSVHLYSEIFLHVPEEKKNNKKKDKEKAYLVLTSICMFRAAIVLTRHASLFCMVVSKHFSHIDKNESLFFHKEEFTNQNREADKLLSGSRNASKFPLLPNIYIYWQQIYIY